jgi:phosphocarrier protein
MGAVETLKIENDLGLHARAAAKIVDLAGQYGSSLFLKKGEREVDGSSILSILTMSCPKGTSIEVRVEGEDADEMLEALKRLFQDKFGEGK